MRLLHLIAWFLTSFYIEVDARDCSTAETTTGASVLSTFEGCASVQVSDLATAFMAFTVDKNEKKTLVSFGEYCDGMSREEKQPCLEEFMSLLSSAHILEEDKATNNDDGVDINVATTCKCKIPFVNIISCVFEM